MTTQSPPLEFRVFRSPAGSLMIAPLLLDLPALRDGPLELVGIASLRVSALSDAALSQLGLLGYAELATKDQNHVMAKLPDLSRTRPVAPTAVDAK